MKTTKALLYGSAVIAALAACINVPAHNLAAAAAKASKLVNRPIAASPHALEEFPWLLRGDSPQIRVRHPPQEPKTYPNNLAAFAAQASKLVNRPIAASPHALEEFPWLLRQISAQAEPSQTKTNWIHDENPADLGAQASPSIRRRISPSTHRGDYP
jgi:hypothetical protein